MIYLIFMFVGTYFYYMIMKSGIEAVMENIAFIRRQEKANEQLLQEMQGQEKPERRSELQPSWF